MRFAALFLLVGCGGQVAGSMTDASTDTSDTASAGGDAAPVDDASIERWCSDVLAGHVGTKGCSVTACDAAPHITPHHQLLRCRELLGVLMRAGAFMGLVVLGLSVVGDGGSRAATSPPSTDKLPTEKVRGPAGLPRLSAEQETCLRAAYADLAAAHLAATDGRDWHARKERWVGVEALRLRCPTAFPRDQAGAP